jgi:protocatechuate 3,4-dioxygenase beta subunit
MPLLLHLVFASALSSAQATGTSAPTTRVIGRIVEDGAGTPIAGASVSVFTMARPSPGSFPGFPTQTITDESGRFVFEGLAPGRYRLQVAKAGFATERPMDMSKETTFQLEAGQTLSDMNISMQRGAVIAGQVLDAASGAPLVDGMVMVMRRFDGAGAPAGLQSARLMPAGPSVTTNDLGEFRLFSLPAGEYFIAALPQQNFGFAGGRVAAGGIAESPAIESSSTTAGPTTTMVMTFYPGTADASAAQAVTVAAGQVASGINFRLLTAQAYQVSGLVVDENGAPVAGAMVMARENDRAAFMGGPGARARSDANGAFTMSGVTSGSYVLMASLPVSVSAGAGGGGAGGAGNFTYFYSDGSRGGAPPQSGQLNITVTDTNVEGLRLVVQRTQ